ncbi:MAG: cytidylate kinase-like family protein [Lachnospiraceae bacterium]|mgnify:CR=1 FL=1|jgi:cytidylate kinase|nr:cytidylate kinase-like family protein [Lachnospiraceae bacterium]MCI8873912.1 cytidylate kinase-like family protein [Lachnospiraceae bacterium]MCI9058498.1 cytidylate kinase-like family protein [Lachnospiraceae bacterium]GFI30780.1 cytidylate kinase [Lachnospiraceae bacterium]
MIITIGREFGSYGHVIGRELAKKLGVKYYDKESMAEEAKKTGKYDELRDFYQEQPVNSLLYVIATDNSAHGQRKVPFEFIRNLAQKEDCVIVGRCGNFILKDHPDMTSVFIHAPLEYRIDKTAASRKISTEKARKLVEKEDKARAGFHTYYADEKWNEADGYQLTIDSSVISIEDAVDLIIDFVNKKQNSRN